MRAMRDYVREVRHSIRESLSMPANAMDVNPCAELAEAGAYLEDVA